MVKQSRNSNSVNTEKLTLGFKINIILKKIRWLGLALGLVFFLINWIFISLNHEGYIKFLELNFSPDGIISFPERVIIIVIQRTIVMSIFWIAITSKSFWIAITSKSFWIAITSKSTVESLYKSSMLNKFLYFLVFVLFASYYLVRGHIHIYI